MITFLQNISFIRPLWLIALVFVCFIPKLIKEVRKKENNWIKICQKHLLSHQIAQNTKNDFFLNLLCVVIGIFLTLALAGFSYEKTGKQFLGNNPPTIIALSLASSMDNNDETPSRLIKAWFKLNDILDNVNNETALVVFTNEPYAITPLTDDKNIIKNFLPLLKTSIVPSQGKRVDRAIEFSCNLIKQAYNVYGDIIILTDNLDNFAKETLKASKKASKSGCLVSILAFGEGDKSNNTLQEVAKLGGGKYLRARDDNSDIKLLLTPNKHKLILRNIKKSFVSDNISRKDNGYIFIPLIMVLLIPFFRKGFLNIIVFLAVFTATNKVYAFEWRSFVFSKEQLGAELIEAEKAEKSLELLENPLWRGGALYKLQNYNDAINEYTQNKDEMSLYNLGNALAWEQKFAEAIKTYDEVILVNPEHNDAIYNREIVKKLLEQNPPPPPPSGGGAGNNPEDGEGDGDANEGGQSNNSSNNGSGNEGNGENNDNPDDNNNDDNSGNGGNNSNNEDEDENKGNGKGGGGGDRNNKNGNDKGAGGNNSSGDNQGEDGNQGKNGSGNNSDNQEDQNKGNQDKSDTPPSEDEQNSKNLLNRIPDDPEALLRHKLKMIHSLKRYK